MSIGVIADHYVAAGGGGGGPTAAFVAGTGANSSTVAKPTGATTGDHLFILVTDSFAVGATGFTTMRGKAFSGSGNSGFVTVLYRKLDGSEGSTFTLTSTTSNVAHRALAYRGGGQPGVIDETNGTSVSTSIPSRVRVPVDGLVVHAFAQATGGTLGITAPSGTTSRGAQTGAFFAVLGAEEAESAGANATYNATPASSSAWSSVAILIPNAGSIPQVVARANSQANSSNAHVTIPSTAQVGDLLVMAVQVTANTVTAGASGWTTIGGPGSASGGTYSANYWWGWKIAASGDIGASVQVTSGGQVWGAACIVIRGAPSSSPVGTAGSASTGTGTTATLGSVSSGAAQMAITLLAYSCNGGAGVPTVDYSTVGGFDWDTVGGVQDGYGLVALGVSAAPNGTSSLAPPSSSPGGGTPTWFSQAVLVGIPTS